EIEQIVKAVAPKPVNVLVSGFNCQLTVSKLTDLGVRRISVGWGLALASWGAFLRAGQTIQKDGAFNLLPGNAASAELNERFREQSYVAAFRDIVTHPTFVTESMEENGRPRIRRAH